MCECIYAIFLKLKVNLWFYSDLLKNCSLLKNKNKNE